MRRIHDVAVMGPGGWPPAHGKFAEEGLHNPGFPPDLLRALEAGGGIADMARDADLARRFFITLALVKLSRTRPKRARRGKPCSGSCVTIPPASCPRCCARCRPSADEIGGTATPITPNTPIPHPQLSSFIRFERVTGEGIWGANLRSGVYESSHRVSRLRCHETITGTCGRGKAGRRRTGALAVRQQEKQQEVSMRLIIMLRGGHGGKLGADLAGPLLRGDISPMRGLERG